MRRRQTRARARSSFPNPSAASRTKIASARSPHDTATPSHAHAASRGGVACSPTQPGQAEAGDDPASADRRGSANTAAAASESRARDDEEAGPEPAVDPRDAERHRGERRHCRTVEQAEQEEREGDCADRGAASPAAPDDREADHLVAPAGQREPAHRGGAARGRERQHCRALPVAEEPLPAPRLRGIRREHDDGRHCDEPEVRVMQRPPREGEVARDECGDNRRNADREMLRSRFSWSNYRYIGSVCPYVVSEFLP